MWSYLIGRLKGTSQTFACLGIIGGFVADVLQPLAPFTNYLFFLASFSVAVTGVIMVVAISLRDKIFPFFVLSDKALEVFEKAGSPTTKKDTKTWDIQSWDASNIHINMGGNLYSWDGTGWVFSIVGDEYQHDKCKVK